ncbi:MAG: DUF354 domain-containing protein [Pyrinomonadaceae bacterium]
MEKELITEDKTIWFDLDNSPHVPLFAPIIRHYRRTGVEVILTARDHAQTIELLKIHGFEGTFTPIGKHYGKSKAAKICGLLARARQLAAHIKSTRKNDGNIAVAVSHGSRSMVLAAKWLKIPVITMYDYEFTETRIFNRFSDKVLVPDAIPDAVLDEIGLAERKRFKYSGIKEELYLREFRPTPEFRKQFLGNHGWQSDKTLAVLRPPATTANYHSAKGEILLDDILHFLISASDVITVIVPRTRIQGEDIKIKIKNIPDAEQRCIVLDEAVNAVDLTFAADLLISGGGTMNREAALLGVPVYSIFAGRQGALDRKMEADGNITFIRDARDFSKFRFKRRASVPLTNLTDRVEKFVIEQIDSMLKTGN